MEVRDLSGVNNSNKLEARDPSGVMSSADAAAVFFSSSSTLLCSVLYFC